MPRRWRLAQAPQADAEALFAGGLAAVRLGQADTATRLFDATYRTAPTPGAACRGRGSGRGTSRSAAAIGARFAIWMRRAALEGDTFYGLIARRALGPAIDCIAGETIGNADLEALEATPQGRRAFALLQVGEKLLAEAELRALWMDTARDGVFDRSLVLAARAMGFGQLAAEIEQKGVARPSGDGSRQAAACQRLPGGSAAGLCAGAPRIELPVRGAVSSAGARGLMQIMPSTAQAVAGGQAGSCRIPRSTWRSASSTCWRWRRMMRSTAT